MKTVAISGVFSGSRKITAAEPVISVLARLRSVAAVKVPHGNPECPHRKESYIDCGGPGAEFNVVDTPSVIEQPNTATFRFRVQAADPVLWFRTRKVFAQKGWPTVIVRIPDAGRVIVESNTVAELISSDVLVMLAGPAVSRCLWER